MSIDGFYTLDVTILRAGQATDGFGNSTADWLHPTSTSTQGWLAQVATQEPTQLGRPAVVTTADVLFVGPDVVIDNGDRVVVDSTTYEVNGRPRAARTPGGVHHLEVPLRSAVG